MRIKIKRYIRKHWHDAMLRLKVIRRPPVVEVEPGFKSLTHLERPRILILKLDHIGDFILGLAAMSDLRTAWPDASITLVCASWNVDLASKTKLFDTVVAYDFFDEKSRAPQKITPERYAGFKAVKLDGPFDIAIDLRHDQDTRPHLEMVDARFRAGYAAPKLKTPLDLELPAMEVSVDRRQHRRFRPPDAELRLRILVQAIIAAFRSSGSDILRRLAREASNKIARPEGRYIVVCPGAGKSTRKWSLQNLISLCVQLAETTPASIVIVGGEGDREDARVIASALPLNRCHNFVEKFSITELPQLLSSADLFIGYDSGITQLAAQLDVRTICIFSGASDARVWKPHGANVTIVKAKIFCSPCYLIDREDCAIEVRCMEIISVADIMSAINRSAPSA